MYPTRGNIHKIIVIRPGALGDVLAVRGTLRLARTLFPQAEISLAAPGERGRLFRRPDWADHVHDWERAAFAWFFGGDDRAPPPTLRAIFARADWILSYIDADAEFERRLDLLAPAAAKVYCPPRPRSGEAVPIGVWLASAALGFCRTYGLIGRETEADLRALAGSRLEVDGLPAHAANAGGYAVIHPGSGSSGKNWPLDNFRELGLRLLETGRARRILVTSGEADGDLGERLAAGIPGAESVRSPSLAALAQILANAALYVGNDSGVSHLAAAVQTTDGRFPGVAAIFGPSDAAVWAPPGAMVLHAGKGMDSLGAEEALAALC